MCDSFRTSVSSLADYLLPISSIAESAGTVINYEFRVQPYYAAYDPTFYEPNKKIIPGWKCFQMLFKHQNWVKQKDVLHQWALGHIYEDKIRALDDEEKGKLFYQKSSRQPPRGSGRTSVRAKIDIKEPRQPQDKDSFLSFSMEGYYGKKAKRRDIPFAWQAGHNSSEAWILLQDQNKDLIHGNPGIKIIPEYSSENMKHYINFEEGQSFLEDREGGNHFIMMPKYHLYGSDELSHYNPDMEGVIPLDYAIMNKSNGQKYSMNKMISLTLFNKKITLPIKIDDKIDNDTILLPIGSGKIQRWMIGGKIMINFPEEGEK